MTQQPTTAHEDLVTAAREGDEAAFGQLVEPYRRELHAHCYRMMASLDDADDMLQEVMLRAWRGLPGFQGRSSFRTWMYRIATNVCLNAIKKQTRRVLPESRAARNGEPATEAVWIGPYPDDTLEPEDALTAPDVRYEERESVELAFIAALQHLPGNQRAALILREVLGFSAREVAEALDTTTAAVNSALQHARRTVRSRVPERSQQATLRTLGDERLRTIVERYATAFERGDVDAIMSLLADDATWSMPPFPEWYQGRDAIRNLLFQCAHVEWRHLPARANGQPAVGCYARNPATGDYDGSVIDVLTLRGEQIASVTAFVDSDLFPRFGLPSVLPG